MITLIKITRDAIELIIRLNFVSRRKSEIVTPSSAVAMSVEVAAQANPEDDEKARKEWRRQATAVVNNAKFNKAISKFLAPVKVI